MQETFPPLPHLPVCSLFYGVKIEDGAIFDFWNDSTYSPDHAAHV